MERVDPQATLLPQLERFFYLMSYLPIPTQAIGGIASAAVRDTENHIEVVDRAIIGHDNFTIPLLRDNGSPKDFDNLILTTKPKDLEAVESLANLIPNVKEKNVFPLHPIEKLDRLHSDPLSWPALKVGVADRYVHTRQNQTVTANSTERPNGLVLGTDIVSDTYMKAAFPFGVEVPIETLETWHLHIKGQTPIPIPHPAMTVLNNLTRSIAGPRRKYDPATPHMIKNMRAQAPELIEWMIDGPGQSHLVLAGVLRAVGTVRSRPRPINLGNGLKQIAAPKFSSLVEHPAFLLRDADPDLQRKALMLTKAKALGVGVVENYFMDWWEQHNFERFFKNQVHNR